MGGREICPTPDRARGIHAAMTIERAHRVNFDEPVRSRCAVQHGFLHAATGYVSPGTPPLAATRRLTVACAPMRSANATRAATFATRSSTTTRGVLPKALKDHKAPKPLKALKAPSWWAAVAILSLVPRAVPAQGPAVPEVRLDLLVGRSAALHLGAALGMRSGLYLRPTVVVAAGPAWQHDTVRTSGRVEALARFVLDPFRESSVGLYAQGGLTALYDPWERWRGLVIVAVGAELPARAGGVWAVEVGLGGGVRLGLALRGGSPGRR